MSPQVTGESDSPQAIYNGQAGERRKVRKGTFSCWECRRRKTRCRFQLASDSTCLSCRRHGVPCISQEIDEPSGNQHNETEEQLKRVEALVSQLQQQRNTRHWKDKNRTSWSPCPVEVQRELTSRTGVSVRRGSKISRRSLVHFPRISPVLTEDTASICGSLNDYLENILPHSATATQIVSCGQSPFAVLEQAPEMTRSSDTNEPRRQNRNPILLAKTLILLALSLERLKFNPSGLPDFHLDAPNCAVARRFVDAARQVTCRDFLVGSFEGIETLMLQSSFETSVGDLQSAWLNIRRASSLAEVIDRTRNVSESVDRAKRIRSRLVLFEHILSLLLGLPSAVGDDNFANERSSPSESASRQLEHIHAAVSGRTITRNRRMQERLQRINGLADTYDDYGETQNMDRELKRAVRFISVDGLNHSAMPGTASEAAAFVEQIRHYDLLVLVHQPYLFHGPHSKSCDPTDGLAVRGSNPEYSRFAAVFASREVLSRVLVCCNNRHIRCSLSGLSHKAFTSSITLLLAHIEGHSIGCGNFLEHQRPGDRKMILEMIDHMEEISRSSETNLSGWSTHVVLGLLAIEEDAANGHTYIASTENDSMENGDSDQTGPTLQFSLPYLGTITVKRQLMAITQPVGPLSRPTHSVELTFATATATTSYFNSQHNPTAHWAFSPTTAENIWAPPFDLEATEYLEAFPSSCNTTDCCFSIHQGEQNMSR